MDDKIKKYLESFTDEDRKKLAKQDTVFLCTENNLLEMKEHFKRYGLSLVPTAHWIGEITFDSPSSAMRECSNCHHVKIVDHYCSHCGARMEEEND